MINRCSFADGLISPLVRLGVPYFKDIQDFEKRFPSVFN